MDTIKSCEKCGAELPADAPRGLCPQCLMQAALADSSATRTPTPSAKAMIGARIRYFGDYELQEKIAQGGMGVVYKARQLTLNRMVAVKMILAGQLAGPEDIERFLTEAEAAANLQHPNIVAIHEVGEEDGQHFFSMDYVQGRNLADHLKDHPFSPEGAARLVKTIADAVHHAHQRGTLHRDLKPQNVLIDASGEPHVTDFGLAKLTERDDVLTLPGTPLGTPGYMPPEQAEGRLKEIDRRSDVYSLGAILYYLLTGRPPFELGTPQETMNAVVKELVQPPAKLKPGLPQDLEFICLKCLEKPQGNRYCTALELADELGRFLNHEPILARPPGVLRRAWNWTQRNPWVLAASFGCVALATGCLAYGLWEKNQRLEALTAGQQSPATRFFFLVPILVAVLFLEERFFRKRFRALASGNVTLPGPSLLLHAGVGIIVTLIAMVFLLLQIRFWALFPFKEPYLVLEMASIPCVMALSWIGLRMFWVALGIREDSIYRRVAERTVKQGLAAELRSWPARKLAGFVLWAVVVSSLGAVWMVITFGEFSRSGKFLFGVCMLMALATPWFWALSVGSTKLWFRFTFVTGILAGLTILAPCVLNFQPIVFALLDDLQIVGFAFICGGVSMVLTWSGWMFFVPTVRRQWLFPPRMFKDLARGTATVGGLVALFYVVENLRYQHQWDRTNAELARKGVDLQWSRFMPAVLPANQNIFAAPQMQLWFAGRGTNEFSKVLARCLGSEAARRPQTRALLANRDPAAASAQKVVYKQLEPSMTLVRQALKRPFARIDADYRIPTDIPVPNRENILGMAEILLVSSHCHLVLREADAALADLAFMHDLRRLAEGPPGGLPETIIASAIDTDLTGQYVYGIGEGIKGHYWSDAQLAALQDQLREIDLPSVGEKALDTLQASDAEMMDKFTTNFWWDSADGLLSNYRLLMRIAPRGWTYQNMSRDAHRDQQIIEQFRDQNNFLHLGAIISTVYFANGLPYPAIISNFENPTAEDMSAYTLRTDRIARNQTEVIQALIACALERYRLAHGQYPSLLQELVPAFLERIPNDLIGGQPPVYHLASDGGFQLSSAGAGVKERWFWPPKLDY